jgi:hypothetical protein
MAGHPKAALVALAVAARVPARERKVARASRLRAHLVVAAVVVAAVAVAVAVAVAAVAAPSVAVLVVGVDVAVEPAQRLEQAAAARVWAAEGRP